MRLGFLIAFFGALCACINIYAQPVSEEEAEAYEAILDSAEFYELISPRRTLALTKGVLTTLPVKGNEVMYVRALVHSANSKKMLSQKDSALIYVNQAIAISNDVGHPELIMRSYYMKASIFGQADDSDSSMIYYQKVIELNYPDAPPFLASGSYSSIGRILRMNNQYQKAEGYLLKAARMSGAEELARLEALAELITLYSEMNDPRYVAYLDTLAMSDFYRKASDISVIAHFDSFLRLENATDEQKLRKLREVYQYSQDNSALVNQIGYGMKLYEQMDKMQLYAEAHSLLLKLLEEATVEGHGNHLTNIMLALSQNSKKQGRLDDALMYLERYGDLRDSLVTVENLNHLNELNVKFETAEKDHEIERQKTSLEQGRRNRNFLTILAILISTLAVFVFVYFRNRARSTRRIADQERVIHAQEKENLLREKEVAELSASLDTQEKERNRIARDLHDGVGSLMSGISAQIEVLRTQPGVQNGSASLSQLRDLVKEATSELRRTSYELMPASLLRQGLEPAIRDLCVNLLVKNGIQPALEINCDLTLLNPDQQLTLYRIVQELLNNIVKHAAAQQVLIQFNQYDGEISLVVEDDGKGFNVLEKKQTGGLGLGSLQSRVNLLKGFLDIASIPDKGTTVTVNFTLS